MLAGSLFHDHDFNLHFPQRVYGSLKSVPENFGGRTTVVIAVANGILARELTAVNILGLATNEEDTLDFVLIDLLDHPVVEGGQSVVRRQDIHAQERRGGVPAGIVTVHAIFLRKLTQEIHDSTGVAVAPYEEALRCLRFIREDREELVKVVLEVFGVGSLKIDFRESRVVPLEANGQSIALVEEGEGSRENNRGDTKEAEELFSFLPEAPLPEGRLHDHPGQHREHKSGH